MKNFAHYGGTNITSVVDGLEKELIHAKHEGPDAAVMRYLEKTHFVFRGDPSGATAMIEKMETKGLKLLQPADDYPQARKLFEKQIENAKAAVTNNSKKTIPERGELVVFQGKDVPL